MASFYDHRIQITDKSFQLSEEESKHICRVLRLKENDSIEILDGLGRIFSCTISIADPKKCQVKVQSFTEDTPPPYDLHIAIAPTKNIDRIEWFVEKATEIGITEITFLSCKNSERTKINEERIQRILVAAMKQSKRTFLPKLNGLQSFSPFVESHKNGLIAYCGEVEKVSLKSALQRIDCPILIGPEGDFHSQEVTHALENGYKTITLGENRLRTETAALVACVQSTLHLEEKR
jgi:16S rRNA (uracil1498-N3)-methyltransferase